MVSVTRDEFLQHEDASKDVIDVKRIYIDMAGDLVAGVLLSQIVFWHLPSKQNGNSKLRVFHRGEYWIAKKREDWWDECRITPKQADRAIKELEDANLIVSDVLKFDGSPTKHIRIDWTVFLASYENLLHSYTAEGGKSKLPKGKNRNTPKGNIEIDQTVKSLTEITPETTPETKESSGQKSPAPPEPPKAEKPAKAKADLFPIASTLSEVCQMPLEINRGRLFREAKQLCAAAVVPPVTPDEVRARYGPGGWWYREDWRGQKGEPPTPAAIRQTWGQWTKAKVIPITRAKPTKADLLAQIQAQWDEEDGNTGNDQSDSPIVFEHIPAESGRSAERAAFAAGMAGRAGRCT